LLVLGSSDKFLRMAGFPTGRAGIESFPGFLELGGLKFRAASIADGIVIAKSEIVGFAFYWSGHVELPSEMVQYMPMAGPENPPVKRSRPTQYTHTWGIIVHPPLVVRAYVEELRPGRSSPIASSASPRPSAR